MILRLRSVMDTISLHYAGQRVMIFSHQVVILCVRHILENLTEAEILDIDAEGDVANCAITDYRFDPDAGRGNELVLQRYNIVAPMEDEDTPVTQAPDATAGARGGARPCSMKPGFDQTPFPI